MEEKTEQAADFLQRKAIVQFEYRMHMEYECPVQKAHFTIKAIPHSDARQQIRNLTMQLLPDIMYASNTDSFGNRLIYGAVRKYHTCFDYLLTGRAEIGQVLYEEVAKEEEIPLFRHAYGLNRSGKYLAAYHERLKTGFEENAYVNAVYIMHCLYQDFAYKKGITNVGTGAEEAWCLGGGVCQDYAHIFIALCRMSNIPARYVTGIVAGEGESHAWAEILYKGKWIGMDPTNDVLVARDHVKFGHGRDASDCQLNRGILFGGGGQHQRISVKMNEE